MEDKNCVVDSANEFIGVANQPRMAFFGVFDGHSGDLAAEFTKTNLPYNIMTHKLFDVSKLGTDGGGEFAKSAEGVREAIMEGYLKTDADFMAIAQKDELKAGLFPAAKNAPT